MNMLKGVLLIALLALSSTVYAECPPSTCMMDQLSVGYGPVRENDGASYRTFRFDERLSTHWEGNIGGIFGGDHPLHSESFDYRTYWFGASYLEVENYLFGSVGVVKLSRQTKHLTSPFQFLITFGVHYEQYSLSYVHLSNGHTGGKNYGEDMLVLAYGF